MKQEIVNYLATTNLNVSQTRQAIESIIKDSTQFEHDGQTQVIKKENLNNEDLKSYENPIYFALLKISENLSKSYAQIKNDIEDDERLSWAGTAHEIREVLGTMLRLLAPDEDVCGQIWYTQEKNTSGPTQKQRVHYILLKNGAGSKERDVVQQVVRLESMIEDIVRLTYSRASDAAHRFKSKNEVIRILRYFEAFAYDLLNLNE